MDHTVNLFWFRFTKNRRAREKEVYSYYGGYVVRQFRRRRSREKDVGKEYKCVHMDGRGLAQRRIH